LRDNLHLTLVFIGQAQAQDAAENAMDALTAKPFMLVFDRIGSFSHAGESLVWLGAAYNKALSDVQRDLAQKLRAAGFNIEGRKYTPHVTLCRRAVPDGPLPNGQVSITQAVTYLSLMKSERDASGMLKYTCIHKKYL
jgi:2'-5' RNA ligase